MQVAGLRYVMHRPFCEIASTFAGCPMRLPQVTKVVHAGSSMEMSRRRGAMCNARSKYLNFYIDALGWVSTTCSFNCQLPIAAAMRGAESTGHIRAEGKDQLSGSWLSTFKRQNSESPETQQCC